MNALAPEAVDLTTTLAGVQFDSPVMTASGCGGTGRELSRYGDLAELGAFVTSSVTRDATAGARLPRVIETPSGVLSATGLPGPGIDGFLAGDLLWLLQHDVRTVVSIAGSTLGEYAELARRVGNTPGITAVEVNLGHRYARDPVLASRVVAVVRRDTAAGVPVFAKLWPGGSTVVDLSAAVVQAGADAVVLTGSQPGLALDPETLRPSLGGVTGELSGPAVRAIGLYAVWEVRRALPDATIIGGGGIRSGTDVVHLLAAGADAVQIGTELLRDPSTPARVVGELRDALAALGVSSVKDVRDRAHRQPVTKGQP